jgi:pimeloyl-ACP methyl ester carboxylesterase
MDVEWDLRRAGPQDAEHTVLLLPGGMCAAGSWAEVMARPELAGTRLVAATLPGHAGTRPPFDPSVEHIAELAARLATEVDADVVAGFSMGASVAFEMVASGRFAGPAVLTGISLSTADEPFALRALDHLAAVLGSRPAALMVKGAAAMAGRLPVPAARREELREDFRRNVPADLRPAFAAYLRHLGREDPAGRLCRAGVPVWVVHAEHGDGGLTRDERRTLEACEHVHLETIPGRVFFLPVEVPDRIASVVAEAVSAGSARGSSPRRAPA